MINAGLQALVIPGGGTVRWCNLDRDRGGTGKKSEPFVVIQHPTTAASGKILLDVIVINGVAIPVQVIAQNWRLLTCIT